MGRVARYKKIKAFDRGKPSVAPKKKHGHKVKHTSRDTFGFNDVMTSEGDIGAPAVMKQGLLANGMPSIPSVPGSLNKKGKKARRRGKKGKKAEAAREEELIPNTEVDEEQLKEQLEEQGGGRIVFSMAAPTAPAKQATMSKRQLKKKQWKTKKQRRRQERKNKTLEEAEDKALDVEKDEVAFGEVADAPPEIDARPRGAGSNLSKEQRSKLAPVRQVMLEAERERVIALYRQQKQRKRGMPSLKLPS